jgi:ankyrin repeat protein
MSNAKNNEYACDREKAAATELVEVDADTEQENEVEEITQIELPEPANNPATLPDQAHFPVHYAAATGNLATISEIINAAPQYDFTERDSDGLTPMHYAARYGHVNIIQRIHQVNPNLITTQAGFLHASPLAYALFFGRTDAIRTLVELGSDLYEFVNVSFSNTATRSVPLLALSAPYESDTIARVFVEHGYQFQANDTLLHEAAGFLNVDLVRYLIQHGASITYRSPISGWLPIFHAIAPEQDIIDALAPDELLMRQQELIDILGNETTLMAQTESTGRSLMHLIAVTDNTATAVYLHQRNPNIIALRTIDDGNTPLHHAAAQNQDGMIAFFIDDIHMNVNDTNRYGHTPLHYAIHKGATAAVKALIARGASITIQNLAGDTPFDEAQAYDAERGIDPESANSMVTLVLREYASHHPNTNMEAIFRLAFTSLRRSGALFWVPLLFNLHQKQQARTNFIL